MIYSNDSSSANGIYKDFENSFRGKNQSYARMCEIFIPGIICIVSTVGQRYRVRTSSVVDRVGGDFKPRPYAKR